MDRQPRKTATKARRIRKIGEGTFGQVIVVNGQEVRKIYDKLRYMLQEVMVLRYMEGSQYIVELRSFNTSVPSVNIERWSTSLRDLMKKVQLSEAHKMKIFKCVLMGLSHLHQLDVLHSDLKSSNILVNLKSSSTGVDTVFDACICDLGLSSLVKYAKVKQTAPKYRPEKIVRTFGHDMFGLAVSMHDLFSGSSISKTYTAKELRASIRGLKVKTQVKNALLRMCPDNPSDAISADEVLLELFGERTTFTQPKVHINESSMPDDRVAFLREITEGVMRTYDVERGVRCFECLYNFFNSENGLKILSQYWPLYISAAIFIYAALFGPKSLDIETTLEITRGRHTKTELYDALDTLLGDDNFVIMTMI